MRNWILVAVAGATMTGCGWISPERPGIEPQPAPIEQEPPETPARSLCEGADAPASCTVERAWGSAIILDRLTLEGTADDPVCCLDINGDGELDNSAGMNIAGLSSDPPRFQTQEQRLANGNDAIVLETFEDRLQWWPAAWADADGIRSGMDVFVEAYAVNAAQQSRYGFITDDDGAVADGGTLEIPIVIAGAPLRVEAQVVKATLSWANDGTSVTGEMGVLTTVEAVFNAFNRGASECGCVDGVEPDGTCKLTDATSCSEACQQFIDACPVMGAVAIFADIDHDEDGLNESISAGYTFHGVPAWIVGIAR